MHTIDRRSFIRLGLITGAGAASLALFGCNGSGTGSGTVQDGSPAGSVVTDADTKASKTLVAFYSAQGHTKAVAQTIADELGTDLFEIVPEQPYTDDDLSYGDSESRVCKEHDDESLRDTPLVQSAPNDFAGYDTVILGYPIWWAVAAWPTNRFAQDNNFAGKRVITFCTSASSGLGDSTQQLADLAGTGGWHDGQRFSSNAEESDIRSWARSL